MKTLAFASRNAKELQRDVLTSIFGMKFTMTINEEMTRTKTFKVNIKPGKTKTMKLNIGKLIADPSNITVKCLKFWYKS